MREHLLTLQAQLPELQQAIPAASLGSIADARHRGRSGAAGRRDCVYVCSAPTWKKKWIVWTRILMPLSRLSKHHAFGRRLDFLMQELNREANTLGSKSTALSTTNVSVDFKVLIEQMREQIQNIE
jgi:hypothetical protein